MAAEPAGSGSAVFDGVLSLMVYGEWLRKNKYS